MKYTKVGETPSADYLLQFLINKTNLCLSSVSLPMLLEIEICLKINTNPVILLILTISHDYVTR